MAHTTISITNGVEIKQAPVGFSWTTLFFGGFPALLRGDFIVGIVLILINAITYGIAGIVAAFIYNKMYLTGMFNKGYTIHAMPNGYTEDMLKAELGLVSIPTKA
jgi:hypothetical protein